MIIAPKHTLLISWTLQGARLRELRLAISQLRPLQHLSGFLQRHPLPRRLFLKMDLPDSGISAVSVQRSPIKIFSIEYRARCVVKACCNVLFSLTGIQLHKVVFINKTNRDGGWATWSYDSPFMPDNVHATATSIEQHMRWLHTGMKLEPRSKNPEVQRLVMAIGLTWRDLHIAMEIEPGEPRADIPLAVQNTSLSVEKHEGPLRALCDAMFASGALSRATREGGAAATVIAEHSAPIAGPSSVGRKRTRSAANKTTADPPKHGTPPPQGPRRSRRNKDVGAGDAPPRVDPISPKKPKAKKART